MSLQTIVAGILALPPLLVTVATIPIVALLSIPAASLLVSRKFHHSNPTTKTTTKTTTTPTTTTKKQVIITGGSSGIGLAIAKEAAQHLEITKIVILARNVERLEIAKQEILACAKKSSSSVVQVIALSVDVTDHNSLKETAEEIMKAEDSSSSSSSVPVSTHLFCCAGEPHPMYLEDMSSELMTQITQINQLGSMFAATSFLPYMKTSTSGGGTITFCSSVCGQIGVFGYAAYCPSKFALRGFAECLHVELLNYPNVHVQIAYPPDVDTPGFAKENETKPVETHLISEHAGLAQPQDIGKVMFHEAVLFTGAQPRFHVYFNLDSFLLCALSCGFSPVHTIWDAVVQLSIMNLTRWVALFYLKLWHDIICKFQAKTPEERDQIAQKIFPNRVKTSIDSSGKSKDD